MKGFHVLVLMTALGAAAACGSPKNADAPRLAETEPNDSVSQPNVVTRNWSTIHLGGTCGTASDVDWFRIEFTTFVQPAPLAATLTWTGAGSLTMNLYDSTGAGLLSSDAAGTSPAVVTSTLTTSGMFFLEVRCSNAASDAWKLDIPAPGQNPGTI